MSNRLTNAFIAVGFPEKVTGTASAIHLLLLHRYDEREYLDKESKKPNRGFRKSYPGMEEICRVLGLTRQAVNEAVELLILRGYIIRVTIGKPGQQAEYVPVYALGLVGEYVNPALHVFKSYKGKKLAEHDKDTTPTCKEEPPKVLSEVYTISTTSNHKYEQTGKEFVRFDLLQALLTTELQESLQAGLSLETLLSEGESKGATIEIMARHLNIQNYSNAHNVSALAVHILKGFVEAYRATVVKSLPAWCGNCESDQHRVEPYPYEVPSTPPGKKSMVCRRCGKVA